MGTQHLSGYKHRKKLKLVVGRDRGNAGEGRLWKGATFKPGTCVNVFFPWDDAVLCGISGCRGRWIFNFIKRHQPCCSCKLWLLPHQRFPAATYLCRFWLAESVFCFALCWGHTNGVWGLLPVWHSHSPLSGLHFVLRIKFGALPGPKGPHFHLSHCSN